MKTVVTAFFAILFMLPAFGQSHRFEINKEEYLAKSKRKEQAGIILVTAGAVVTGGSTVLIIDGIHRNNSNYNNGSGDITNGDAEILVGVLGGVIGVASMSASIPFFVGAHHSRMRALLLSLKTEHTQLRYQPNITGNAFPALSLRLPLSK